MRELSRYLLAGLLLLVAANTASACIASLTTPNARAEGTTEFLGTVTLNCTAIPLPTATPTIITVTLIGVNFSPTSSSPDNVSSFPLPLISSTVPFMAAPAASVGGSTATFAFTPTAGAQTITITGLRANIAASGITSGFITASVNLGGGLPGGPFLGVLAIVQQGLADGSGFSNRSQIITASPLIPAGGGTPANVVRNPDPSPTAANSAQVTFVENFAGAFRTAANEDGGTPGIQGTRLRIQLTGIPDGIIPYAPRAVRSTSNSSTGTISPVGALTVIQRVGTTNADGSGGAVLGEIPDQFDMITVSSGTATIVYEVTTDDPNLVDTITFFVALVAVSQPASGTINGAVSLAPVGPPTLAPARPQFTFALTPILSVSSTQLTFVAHSGSNPAPQTLRIANSGIGVLNWGIVVASITGGNWLTFSPASGAGDASVSVTVNSGSLAVGTYNATFTVSAAGAANSPQAVLVSLIVSAIPTLLLNPSSLNFSGSSGSNPAAQPLTVSSLNDTVNWTATATTSSGGNWLSLSATSGTTPSSVSVAVNTAGLAAGTYQGTITVSAPATSNTPQIVAVTLILGTPAISLNPAALVFTTSVGQNPAPQSFQVLNMGSGVLGWTATVATQSGSNWLSVSPSSAVAPSTITVTVTSAGLPQGAYTGTVTITALPGSGATNSPQVLTVSLAIGAPVVAQNGVVNAASFSKDAVIGPGSIASLFGTSLATTAAAATTTILPTMLGGTQVLVNAVPAPLIYVSPSQINFQMPPGVSGPTAQIVVVSNGISGSVASVNIVPAAPGIFTLTPGGTGQGAVLNEDSSPNSTQNQAAAGSVIQIFATGLGATTPPAIPGQPAGVSPLSVTTLTPVVLIGGVPAEVLFSGLAPGFAGLYQVNARVPAGTPAGNGAPLQIQIGGRGSNPVTIAVR